jgi:hypothetical protein
MDPVCRYQCCNLMSGSVSVRFVSCVTFRCEEVLVDGGLHTTTHDRTHSEQQQAACPGRRAFQLLLL